MQQLFLLAQNTGEPIDSRLGITDWPWTWVRVALYVQHVKNVREQVAVLVPGTRRRVIENAMPLRWMYFDQEKLDEHLAELRGAYE